MSTAARDHVDQLAAVPREHLAEALAALSRVNYDAVRDALAKRIGNGIRVTTLDALYKEGLAAAKEKDEEIEHPATPRKSQVTRLIEIAEPLALFHDREGTAYAELGMIAHREVWPIESKAFRDWLSSEHYRLTATGCNRNSIADALTTIQARAKCCGEEREVHHRVAERDGVLFIDLADERWRCVKITAQGWEVLDRSPVMFTRKRTSEALPVPERGGSIDELWPFLNVAKANRPLVAGWLIGALHPHGPYPVMIFQGEAETAKTTASRILRKLIDPCTVPLKAPPRDERDFLAVAANGWVTAFDNLSGLQLWQSNAVCRLSTGGGHSGRALYTNMDEFAIELRRPVILNGIHDITTEPDLASRALILALQPISDHARREESELWDAFEERRPRIFGGLLDALSCALRRLPETKLDSLPRMADFARWVTAAESGFGWQPGTFMAAYKGNIKAAVSLTLEASPVAQAVLALMEGRKTWSGTATELLSVLLGHVSERTARSKAWPKGPHILSGKLADVSPSLRKAGLDIEISRGAGVRRITIVTLSDAETPIPSVDEESKNRDIYAKTQDHVQGGENSVTSVTSDQTRMDARGDVTLSDASVTLRDASDDGRKPSNGASYDAYDACDAVFQDFHIIPFLRGVCEGIIDVEQFASHLSAEDIRDIEAGRVSLEHLRRAAESMARRLAAE